MDENGITQTNGADTGEVGCRRNTSPTEALRVRERKSGTFTIESVKYPGVFLHMDGSGIRGSVGSGTGHVNCQFGTSDWEYFKLHEQSDGSYTIESVTFPNVFLHMDGNDRSVREEDLGTVDYQYRAGTCEKFYLLDMPETDRVRGTFNKFTK